MRSITSILICALVVSLCPSARTQEKEADKKDRSLSLKDLKERLARYWKDQPFLRDEAVIWRLWRDGSYKTDPLLRMENWGSSVA